MSQPPAGGYPPPDQPQPGGYPPPAQPGPPSGGYPPPAPGYAPPPAYTPPPGPAPGGYQPPPAPGYAPPPPGAAGYPPPPAAGGYPPPAPGYQPPPPAGYGAPGAPGYPPPAGAAASSSSFDASKVGTGDWIIIGSGVVLLIFSFFGWLSASVSYGGYSASTSAGAWHEYWWLATVCGVAVSVIVGLRATMGQAISQIKPLFLMIIAAAGFVITLIALIEIFAKTGDDGVGFSYGPGFGIWVCLIVAAAQTYFVWLWGQRQPAWNLPKLPGPAL